MSGQGRDWMSFGQEPEAVTDAAGAFEVKGVAAGTVQVTATHPGFARSESRPRRTSIPRRRPPTCAS